MSLPNINESYALLRVKECPRCGKSGSLHLKKVQRGHYYYIAHYDVSKHGVHWCYVRKAVAVSLLSTRISDVEDAEIIGVAEKPSVFHGKLRVRQGKSPCFVVMKANSPNTPA